MESPCECGIEPPGTISHGISKPTGKRRRWEDNIRMDLEETGINAGNLVDSAQDSNYWRSPVNAALNLLVP